VSVGHVARAIEEAGVPTVAVFIRAFRHVAQAMTLPRVLITPHLMGRTIGPPGARERQREVVTAALRLASEATGPGTMVTFEPTTPAWGEAPHP
jgi:hypothetical protein